MITGKINVTKIEKERLFKGKNGTYLDIVLFPKKEPDKFGNTHIIVQSISKEEREAGKRGEIIGDAKITDGSPTKQRDEGLGRTHDDSGDKVPF